MCLPLDEIIMRANMIVGSPSPSGWRPVNCVMPFHDDKEASGSCMIDENGFSYNCFGCKANTRDFADATGIPYEELRNRNHRGKHSKPKNPRGPSQPKPKKGYLSSEQVTAIAKEAEKTAAELPEDPVWKLCNNLHVKECAAHRIGVGYEPSPRHPDGNIAPPYWTFPERDAQGKIIGINRRYQKTLGMKKDKKQLASTERGLTYDPESLKMTNPRMILCPEGGSGTLAGMSMYSDCIIIGRPSADSGFDILADTLAPVVYSSLPEETPIILIGDNDKKENGLWPGKTGIVKGAQALANRLKRPVSWCMPPELSPGGRPIKDIRDLFGDSYGIRSDAFYEKVGDWLRIYILANMVTVYPVSQEVIDSAQEIESALPEVLQITQSEVIYERISSYSPSKNTDAPITHAFSLECHENHDYVDCDCEHSTPAILDGIPEHSNQNARVIGLSEFCQQSVAAETGYSGPIPDYERFTVPVESDPLFNRKGFCYAGPSILMLGINRMVGKGGCTKIGCKKKDCVPCAGRYRYNTYDMMAARFSIPLRAGGQAYFAHVAPERMVATQKALNRADLDFYSYVLPGCTLYIVLPKTEDGQIVPHKPPPPGFTPTDNPYKMAQIALSELDTKSSSTPVTHSETWEYEEPRQEPQWKFVSICHDLHEKVVWAIQASGVENIQLDKMKGKDIVTSISFKIPDDWTPEDISNAYKWWSMGEPFPADRRAPRLADYARLFKPTTRKSRHAA